MTTTELVVSRRRSVVVSKSTKNLWVHVTA